MKEIIPSTLKYDISAWDTAMEKGRIRIELKIPCAYSDEQFTQDYLNGAMDTPCKLFRNEISSIKNKWLLGTDATLTKDFIRKTITQMYLNMVEDGTWEQGISETSQIIALTTKIGNLENEIKKTIALTTVASNGNENRGGGNDGQRRSQRAPYTVRAWRLEKTNGDSFEKEGQTWHWCTKDHWSGGKVHNGMYCHHATKDHDAWRIEQDKAYASKKTKASTTPAAPTPASNKTEAETKKLALSDKLRTALTTQAGLSSEAYSKIWDEACKDSGNA